MSRRASGGRWGSIPGVGLCRGRPGSGVRRWADLAGANGSSAIVLGNFGGLGRRGMGQGAAIWGGGGRAQLGLENMGVEGVVPRWAELCSPAMVWARAWRPGAPIYRGVRLVAKVWGSWGRSNWDAVAWGMPGSGARQWPSPWRAHRWRVRVASPNGAKRGRFWEDQGRTRWFGPGARHLSVQVAGAGVRRRRWTRCRETEVEETVSGNLVNKLKFQNQFCNFKFSPSSWLQMKKC